MSIPGACAPLWPHPNQWIVTRELHVCSTIYCGWGQAPTRQCSPMLFQLMSPCSTDLASVHLDACATGDVVDHTYHCCNVMWFFWFTWSAVGYNVGVSRSISPVEWTSLAISGNLELIMQFCWYHCFINQLLIICGALNVIPLAVKHINMVLQCCTLISVL